MFRLIKRIFAKPNAWAVLLYDGHLHYWCGNVFTTKANARRWADHYAYDSESIIVKDIVPVWTKELHGEVLTKLNPEIQGNEQIQTSEEDAIQDARRMARRTVKNR